MGGGGRPSGDGEDSVWVVVFFFWAAWGGRCKNWYSVMVPVECQDAALKWDPRSIAEWYDTLLNDQVVTTG